MNGVPHNGVPSPGSVWEDGWHNMTQVGQLKIFTEKLPSLWEEAVKRAFAGMLNLAQIKFGLKLISGVLIWTSHLKSLSFTFPDH